MYKLSTLILITICYFINLNTIVSQVPVKVANKSIYYNGVVGTLNGALFIVGGLNNGSSNLLKYNEAVDSFEVFKDGNGNQIKMGTYGECLYEFNNNLYLLTGYGVYVIDNKFQIVKLTSCNNDIPNDIYPHASIYNKLYFACDGTIWESDGTKSGSIQILNLPDGVNNIYLNSCGTKLFIAGGIGHNYYYDVIDKTLVNIDNIDFYQGAEFYNSILFK